MVVDSLAETGPPIPDDSEPCRGNCSACAAGVGANGPPCLGARADPAIKDRFLRAVLLNMSEAVIATDARGTILFFSPGSEQLLGYSALQAVGKNVAMIMTKDHAAHHGGYMERYLLTGQSGVIGRTRELCALHKSGKEIPVDLRVVPLDLGGTQLFIGSMRDVRERVEREARLAATKRQLAERNLQLRDVLRSVSEGVCLFDGSRRLQTFNPRALELFRLAHGEIRRGDPLSAVLSAQFACLGAEAAEHKERALARIKRGERHAFKIALDEAHALRVAMTPLWDGRIVETATDVSDEEQVAAQLRRALSAERSASEAKSSFLASMNHELRTPLNAILGMTDAILQGYCGALSDRQSEYLQDIHAAGKHLRDLIGDILDLSKIESGSFRLVFDRCSPQDLVGDCVRIVQGMARDAGLRLDVDAAPDIGDLVIDVRVMKQAILNLLSNAIKFTPSGGNVSVRVSRGELGGVRIEIADSGIGMSAKDLATALSLFGQVENVMNRRHSGTGLGLPLARAFVELHGGSLQVDSAPGQGTRVTLRLPPACVA